MNPISQTSPDRWGVPRVISNRQSISIQLARELVDDGHEVTVFMADPFRPEVADEGADVRYLPVTKTLLTPPAQIPFMPSLVRAIRAGGFDAVVTSEVFQLSTLTLAIARGLPPLYIWHEADTYQRLMKTIPARIYYATAGRVVMRAARGFMPRTDRACAFLMHIGVPAAKMGPEVPNGIDDRLFVPERGLRSETPMILFVGSLIERKNPSLAIRAMSDIRRAFPDARLLMKGFGEQEKSLRRLCEELDVSGSVEFDTTRSSLEDMPRIYNRAWVCVFPSFRDFASLSPIEAVACGVPVVLAERLFSAEYLEATSCGVAVSDDSSEFARAVIRQISEYGRDGLPFERLAPVVRRFSLDGAAQALARYLEETMRS